MINLGLVDPTNHVGFVFEPAVYDALKQTDMKSFQLRYHRDASGLITRLESGQAVARLFDSSQQKAVDPVVKAYASRGAAGIPNRVGVVFFHRLNGSRVLWELDARKWVIEYP